MNIGDVSKSAGLPAKTIRYYEDIGLITPARDTNGYRSFCDSDVHKLTFLGRARALGFTIENCRDLLALWDNQDRASADVRAIAQQHLAQIESKIADIKNVAGIPGASIGAAVIGTFIDEDLEWVHLDIAGVDWRDEATPTAPVGHAGWGVRFLDELVRREAN